MAINLTKGQSIILSKSEYDLSKLTMGLGWDVGKSGGFWGKLLGFDLDGYALLLGEDGKLKNNNEVISFQNLRSPDQTVVHSGDNLTGKGEGDDEQIVVKLGSLPEKYHKIVLGVEIFTARMRKQHFGMVKNAFVRAIDAKGIEIARYSLSGNASYDGKICMLMGEIYKQAGDWNFRALGDALDSDRDGVIKSFLG
jgi:stress response protein SCP2